MSILQRFRLGCVSMQAVVNLNASIDKCMEWASFIVFQDHHSLQNWVDLMTFQLISTYKIICSKTWSQLLPYVHVEQLLGILAISSSVNICCLTVWSTDQQHTFLSALQYESLYLSESCPHIPVGSVLITLTAWYIFLQAFPYLYVPLDMPPEDQREGLSHPLLLRKTISSKQSFLCCKIGHWHKL